MPLVANRKPMPALLFRPGFLCCPLLPAPSRCCCYWPVRLACDKRIHGRTVFPTVELVRLPRYVCVASIYVLRIAALAQFLCGQRDTNWLPPICVRAMNHHKRRPILNRELRQHRLIIAETGEHFVRCTTNHLACSCKL